MGIAKIKSVLMVTAVFVHAVAFAFNPQMQRNGRGDHWVCASGGGLSAEPVSIGLNLAGDEEYSIYCQIHYWDKKLESRNVFDGKYIALDKDSGKHADAIGEILNSFLEDFLEEFLEKFLCKGGTVKVFIDYYREGDFWRYLRDEFPEYVRERLEKEGWKDECDIGDNIVIVVKAERVLRDELDSLILSGE